MAKEKNVEKEKKQEEVIPEIRKETKKEEVIPIVEEIATPVKNKMIKVAVQKNFSDLFVVQGRYSGEKGQERMYPDFVVPHLRRNGYVI